MEELARHAGGELGLASVDDGRPAVVRLEDLTPGARVSGIGGRGEVGVVEVQWHGTNAVTVAYRTDDGRIDEALLYRDHEPELRLAKASTSSAFDADPNDFKLAAEACRLPRSMALIRHAIWHSATAAGNPGAPGSTAAAPGPMSASCGGCHPRTHADGYPGS